ncbi:MAG: dolichyl-phosphate-mannose--protein mannosyltransferase [Bacteroides sp.]|nr:dolichyl-phosphate-mannose--protein mannosyltransferase [Bacteroides sp.]MCM1379497.1 dolichyl-phosphate-mannose--protein mannosyltransferase [Bacteroides sp.]MCM1445900.1 dolichyl-phosphate-mannose--protein mannosyltransferase [Prevotella sp.]
MKTAKESTWWIYAVAALAMLPVLLLRDVTPDNELRYLSIADEAIRNGSLWCFHNHGEIYADKPPLYMWIVIVGRMLFGQYCHPFIELFSLIPMLLVGRIMNGMARPWMDIRRRQVALLMLFTCGYFPGLALTMRMDMLLTLFIVFAVREAFRMAQGAPSRKHEALLGLYCFLALFTKGPYGILIPLFATVVYLIMVKRFSLILRIWGWPAWAVLLGGCAVWFGGVYCEGGSEYLNNLLFHQTVDRAHNAFTHDWPWWYYCVHVWYVMAPWSLFILWELIARRDTAARGDFRKLMIATFCATFVLLSCVSSKLQVYLLPAIPFGVYLGASLMSGPRLQKAVRIISYCILGILFIAGCFMPIINPLISYGPVCREVAKLNPPVVCVSSEVRRAENIDAYFNCPILITDLSNLDASDIIIIEENEPDSKLRFYNSGSGI